MSDLDRDMKGGRIRRLGAPQAPDDAARLMDVQQQIASLGFPGGGGGGRGAGGRGPQGPQGPQGPAGSGASGALTSGSVTSGFIGDAAVVSGSIASGQVAAPHLAPEAVTSGAIASGQVGDDHIASGAVEGFFGKRHVASGTLGVSDLGSGAVVAGAVGSGAVQSANIGSGQVGQFHVASGAITSGRLGVAGAPDGTRFLRDDFTWATAGGGITSGAVASGDIASGAVQGFFGTTRNIASGTVGVDDLGSGAVVAGTVGSGAVRSGNIASGQVGQFHLGSGAVTSATLASGQVSQFKLASGAVNSGHVASGAVGFNAIASGQVQATSLGSGAVLSGHIGSGQVGQFHIASGAVVSGRIGNQAVVSGSIASGQVGTVHLASGTAVDIAELLVDEAFITAEPISGAKAVSFTSSGAVQIAMAAVPTRMPAVGVVVENLTSGQPARIFHKGRVFSTEFTLSGGIGQPVFVGNSGEIQVVQPALSGSQIQALGVGVSESGFFIGTLASGDINNLRLSPVAVRSGHVGSGAIQGAFGATRHIASGTIGPDDLGSGAITAGAIGSGAIRSGNIASGQVGPNHLGSGAVTSGAIASGQVGQFHLASGAVTSATLASGQVSQFKLASGAVNSGHVGSGAVGFDAIASGQVQARSLGSGAVLSGHVGSGQIGQFHVASGSITSGRLGVAGAPDGTKFLRDDFTWVTPADFINSGSVQSGDLGSGAVQGFFGTTRNVASGTLGVFDLGSGAVVAGTVGSGAVQSGNIASGQVGPNHLGSGAVTSGAIASGQVGQFHLGSGAVTSATLASGQVSQFKLASGAVNSGHVGSGAVGFDAIASGQVQATSLGSGAVLSGHVGSGQIGQFHVASGSITSGRLGVGGTPDGTRFLRDDFTWATAGGGITSGSVASGDIASGAVQGFFGTTRNIASGTIGVDDLGSGAVVAGTVGSGAVLSANIASGQIGDNHFASGAHIDAASYNFSLYRAGELISGTRAVFIALGGPEPVVKIAQPVGNAGITRITPAIGVVVDQVSSGDLARVYHKGPVYGEFVNTAGLSGLSQPVIMLLSGRVGTAQNRDFNVIQGSGQGQIQVLGTMINGSGVFLHSFQTSGTVMADYLVSGQVVQNAGQLNDVNNLSFPQTMLTAEAISGTRAVTFRTVGVGANPAVQVIMAMAALSGRMPAVGLLIGNYASGDPVYPQSGGRDVGIILAGRTPLLSGQVANLFSGASWSGARVGQPLFVGNSGELRAAPPDLSGSMIQAMGIGNDPDGVGTGSPQQINLLPYPVSGDVNWLRVGSGAIRSGNIASGQVGTFHVASGTWVPEAGFVATAFSGLTSAAPFQYVAGEDLSSGIACVHTSGRVGTQLIVRRSTPAEPTTMPAMGVVVGNGSQVSGQHVRIVTHGPLQNAAIPAPVGTVFIVGLSGQLEYAFPGLSIQSGYIQQPIGYVMQNSGIYVMPAPKFSGQLRHHDLSFAVVRSGHLQSGAVVGRAGGGFDIASGSIGPDDLASGAVTSGRLAVGGTPDGTRFLRDDFTWATAGGSLSSGQVTSGFLGNASVVSGSIASGQIGRFHLASGLQVPFTEAIYNDQFIAGTVISGQPLIVTLESGSLLFRQQHLSGPSVNTFGVVIDDVNSGERARAYQWGPIYSPRFSLLSGRDGQFVYQAGAGTIFTNAGGPATPLGFVISGPGMFVRTLDLGSGNIDNRWLASGAVRTQNLNAGAVRSGNIGSGQVDRYHLASGAASFGIVQVFQTAELISGLKAVALASGTDSIVRAERASGLRLPALGVTRSGGVSGAIVEVVMLGPVTHTASGMLASGFHGQALYVGSGGIIVNRSGFMGGAPFLSGDAQQMIGISISGGLFVRPDTVTRSGFANVLPPPV